MLVNSDKEYAKENWPTLWKGIGQSFSNPTEEYGQRILLAIQREVLNLWLYIKEGECLGAVLTTGQHDVVSGNVSLLIYAIYSAETLTSEDIRKGFQVLVNYSQEIGAVALAFYTQNEKLTRFATRLGAMKETYITIPTVIGDKNVPDNETLQSALANYKCS